MLQSVFGSEGSPIIQYVSIFAVIFAVLTVIVLVMRRLTGGGLAAPGRGNQRGRQPRLGIVDVYELDRQRQLILLRRDNVEHLLLVGGPNDVVIERNIQRGRALGEPSLRPDALHDPLPEPEVLPEPAEPALEPPGALPPPLAGLTARRPEPAFEPRFEMPVVVPPAVPRSNAAPPVTHPLDAAALGPDEGGEPAPVPQVTSPDRPRERQAAAGASGRGEPVEDAAGDTAKEPAKAATTEPAKEGPARRLLRRTAPPLANPTPPAPAPATEPPAEPSAAAPSGPPRRSVDPAILSDMARQLQEALSRPSSAVTPPPGPPASPQPAPQPAPHRPEPRAPEADRSEPKPPAPTVDPMAAAMAAAPEPAVAPPVQPRPVQPAPAPAPAAPAAPPAAAEPKPAPKPAAPNPFSVEEIEAEFARLLGRPLDKR